jgi:K+-sensing histidine kinase KdpD
MDYIPPAVDPARSFSRRSRRIRGQRILISRAAATLFRARSGPAARLASTATTVNVRASCKENRVLIDVEDECGGLPPGDVENLLRPFTQRGRDRSG